MLRKNEAIHWLNKLVCVMGTAMSIRLRNTFQANMADIQMGTNFNYANDVQPIDLFAQ